MRVENVQNERRWLPKPKKTQHTRTQKCVPLPRRNQYSVMHFSAMQVLQQKAQQWTRKEAIIMQRLVARQLPMQSKYFRQLHKSQPNPNQIQNQLITVNATNGSRGGQ